MPNRSVMTIKVLKEENVNVGLPRLAVCLVESKQISPRTHRDGGKKKLTAGFVPR